MAVSQLESLLFYTFVCCGKDMNILWKVGFLSGHERLICGTTLILII